MNDRPEKKAKTEPFLMVPKPLAARTDLHPIDKLVWACIRDRLGNNGKAWPGGRTLAADLGVSRPTVLDALDRLAAAGDLLVERRGRGRTNHYRTPPASGQEPLPVETPKRSRTLTSQNAGSGQEPLRAVVKNLDPNTDPLNQTHKKSAAAPPTAEEKASSKTGKPKPRNPDPWWDTTREVFGLNPVTKSDKSRMGKLARDFKAKCEATGVGLDEIKTRRAALAAKWDGRIVVTPEALLKHWETAGPEQSPPVDGYSGNTLNKLRSATA